MNLSPEAWGWLAGSVVVALILDAALMRVLLEALKPTSAYAFWIGRASKLAAVAAWFFYLDRFWFPSQAAQDPPALLMAAEWGLWLALLLLAVVTVPRVRRGRS
jgi:hypothetical protein